MNNAGISRNLELEGHDLNDIRKVFDTNFFGTIDITQQLLPTLRESKGFIPLVSIVSSLLCSKNVVYETAKIFRIFFTSYY